MRIALGLKSDEDAAVDDASYIKAVGESWIEVSSGRAKTSTGRAPRSCTRCTFMESIPCATRCTISGMNLYMIPDVAVASDLDTKIRVIDI